jgi:protein TonB
LGHALGELGMQVEHCPEIFGAVESLTLQSFDVIVVDWADEPEASFLLQAAHELKSKQPPFSVAIVDVESNVDQALRAGANQVLVKGQARQDLFPFQSQPVAGRAGDVVYAQDRNPAESAPRFRAASFADAALPHNIQESDTDLSFADDLAPPKKRRRRLKRVKHLSHKTHRAYKGALAVAALLLAVIFLGWRLGYLVEPELSKASRLAARVQQARARVSQEIENWLNPSQSGDMDESSVAGEVSASTKGARRRSPLSKPFPAATAPEPPSAQIVPVPASPAESAPPVSQPMTVAEKLSDRIPESLKQPPQLPTVRSMVVGFPSTLLGALEPVLVPEEISRKLLIQKTQPSYPEQALRAGLQGRVVLQALIGRDGKIRDLKLVRGYLVLGRAAFEAVKQWRFQPYYLNGQAMETETYITVNFDLPLQAAPSVSNQ